MTLGSFNRRLARLGVGLVFATFGLSPAVWGQDGAIAAWRVECTGDGKALDCRAIQQMFNRDDKQLVVQLTARGTGSGSEGKGPTLTMQLPLGISLTEPVQVRIDNGAAERYQVQTCASNGCIVNVPLKEPLLAALRTGTSLKITMQAPDKRTLNVDVPLLGFGLAFDKAK